MFYPSAANRKFESIKNVVLQRMRDEGILGVSGNHKDYAPRVRAFNAKLFEDIELLKGLKTKEEKAEAARWIKNLKSSETQNIRRKIVRRSAAAAEMSLLISKGFTMPTPTSRSQSPDSRTTRGRHRQKSSVVRSRALEELREEDGPVMPESDEGSHSMPFDHSPFTTSTPTQDTISMLTAHFDSKLAALEFNFETKLAELQSSFDAKFADANARIHLLNMQVLAQNMGIYDDMGVLRRDVEGRMREEMELIGNGISENVGNVRSRVGRVEEETRRLERILERVVQELMEREAGEEGGFESESETDSESHSDEEG
ncbi:uncharacterized protein BDZ99DRAFT_576663 [Mytilinidion resinicola]|uniref:Uncharacterized protein n=1 Tax=Mytilinidion resinicola TaxID=574789 RepID=A0A6A6Y2Q1_9PEZI|nr:uncharacterized protein BDZ99DRAFT_576663 [Mytilinidion resinicola]KAF2802798.1 hypothetical protein BDZ99DRAFT_576663 [Mytilinidion resinicola]